jgi:REP element-mobilizing transposase RayT
MSHSYNKIWIHAIYSTKNRFPLINPAVEKQIHEHMREQLIENGCPVRIINGMPDHVHLLFLQNPKTAITDIIKQVKGNTSHWINEQNLIQDKFSWQTGYAAYSVSESQLERVFQYIKNQKEHHLKKTFTQEYDEFIVAHGLINEVQTQTK